MRRGFGRGVRRGSVVNTRDRNSVVGVLHWVGRGFGTFLKYPGVERWVSGEMNLLLVTLSIRVRSVWGVGESDTSFTEVQIE
jgi:hypothetical protein